MGRCFEGLDEKNIEFETGKSYCLVVHNKSYGKHILKKFICGDLENNLIIEPDSNIGIDDIREVIDFLDFRSANDKKTVVIFEADKMTQEAANAFLKTLEEPPEYGIIILVTSRYASLLPTIKSRVQKINVKFPALSNDLSDFEKHIVFWNFDYLERIKNGDYVVLSEDDLQNDEIDELSALLTLKSLVDKYQALPFDEFLKFTGKLSKINNFKFLKIFSKVISWYIFQKNDLSKGEKLKYLKICDEIQKSKLANFNYQLTYHVLLLGLRGDNL